MSPDGGTTAERTARRCATVGLVVACIGPVVGLQLLDHEYFSAAMLVTTVLDVSAFVLAIVAKRTSAVEGTRNRAQYGLIVAVLGLLGTALAAGFYVNMSSVQVH